MKNEIPKEVMASAMKEREVEKKVEKWLDNIANSPELGQAMEEEFYNFTQDAFLDNKKHSRLRRKLQALKYLEGFVYPEGQRKKLKKGEPDILENARFHLGCQLADALLE